MDKQTLENMNTLINGFLEKKDQIFGIYRPWFKNNTPDEHAKISSIAQDCARDIQTLFVLAKDSDIINSEYQAKLDKGLCFLQKDVLVYIPMGLNNASHALCKIKIKIQKLLSKDLLPSPKYIRKTIDTDYYSVERPFLKLKKLLRVSEYILDKDIISNIIYAVSNGDIADYNINRIIPAISELLGPGGDVDKLIVADASYEWCRSSLQTLRAAFQTELEKKIFANAKNFDDGSDAQNPIFDKVNPQNASVRARRNPFFALSQKSDAFKDLVYKLETNLHYKYDGEIFLTKAQEICEEIKKKCPEHTDYANEQLQEIEKLLKDFTTWPKATTPIPAAQEKRLYLGGYRDNLD